MNNYILIGIIVAALIIFSYIIYLIFSKPKKKKDPETGKDSVEEQKKEEERVIALTNKVKISIYKPISDSLFALTGKPFIAEEKRDANNNTIVINESKHFKEDFNFSVDRIYEIMNFSLNLSNKSKYEKETLLNKQIRDQEQLLRDIDKDVNLNKIHNYPDEELKLRQLKVYKESLKRETTGNYMRLGEGGIRHYEFVAIDGILYPYFFGSKIYRVYPDLLIKKKIFNQENTIFRNETNMFQQSIMNWIMIVTLIIGIVMMVVGIGTGVYYNSKLTEITTIANKGAITCTNTLANMQSQYGDTLIEYLEHKRAEIESIKNAENHNNINTPQSTDIIINPDKLKPNK